MPAPETQRIRISACLIARDAAATIERALESVRGVADELVVVDTGSRDDTPARAARLGAQVSSFAWCDDFAAARNASLARASGAWILVIDADEELATHSGEARAALERFAAAHARAAGRVALVNVGDADADGCISITRFLPKLAGLAYAGRVHEQPLCAGVALRAHETGLTLHHRGYTRAALEGGAKLERNRALLERALAETPGDGYLWYQFGRTRTLQRDAGAKREALAAFERALERCPAGAPWGPPLVEAAAGVLRELGHSERALALVEELLCAEPTRPDAHFLAGLLSADLGLFERAEHCYRTCLLLGPAAAGPAESSPSAGTWAPAHNLGVLCEVLGRGAEARTWYERALTFHPGHAPSLQGLARLA